MAREGTGEGGHHLPTDAGLLIVVVRAKQWSSLSLSFLVGAA